jgi:dihydroorotase-like cyclic amidohydrolase
MILKGGDGDIVPFDDKRRYVIGDEYTRGRSGYTIYKNLELIGAPLKMVISRGRKVIVDGRTVGAAPGHGKYVRHRGC